MFSGQRKKDYEELIVLRNTVTAFVNEIEETLPPLTEENLKSLRDSYTEQKRTLSEKHKNESDAFEKRHLITLDEVAEQICSELDRVLPDNFVDYLYLLIKHYEEHIYKVNSSIEIVDGVFNMMFVDYPIDFFVQSQIVASVIKDKCKKLLENGAIRFPVAMSMQDAPSWMILNDNSNPSLVQSFIHSIMFGMLSAAPVSHLIYDIVDPENRGNSIFPLMLRKNFLNYSAKKYT